ncbi:MULTISPECIES: hypothetical protein [Rhizobium]|uniref:hypothetical protein n=1 Tax=Rhizobium TaxID=379 RepID=UPI00098ECF0B|nr:MULTISPECIES: hypothetical protein [Rhizobium]MBB5255587.1 hypothetical protein [Rhizobium leguminosarum]MDX6000919.1 hypothetical protein [Rhizobium leguminosarum]OOO44391.1 hypothetical protein BS629_30170 [Rhizobium leguminosarum bv. viciae USDA 2370]PUB62875.1 hypothetical protein DB728_14080 [Rhizobium leguminosarum bv. viciae USDA 2370]TBB97703.1 hypothetical protein ELH39_10830 [Rhizobium ruizarguesonis]
MTPAEALQIVSTRLGKPMVDRTDALVTKIQQLQMRSPHSSVIAMLPNLLEAFDDLTLAEFAGAARAYGRRMLNEADAMDEIVRRLN